MSNIPNDTLRRSTFNTVASISARIRERLITLYGDNRADDIHQHIMDTINSTSIPPRGHQFSELDVMLIAYGDHVRPSNSLLGTSKHTPLAALHTFVDTYFHQAINTIHILPFYPYSSDDGFSVIDYHRVNPVLGKWQDIELIGCNYQLMFDLVLNHVSISSDWFQSFLQNKAPYNRYFITADPTTDLSQVTRPRTHPLLTPFQTKAGTQYIWTTFSTDQVDLNFAEPAVLLEIIRTLLFYVQKGADFIRLDAIAYLWKEIDTTCIHLPQTHLVVKLFRDVLDIAAPWVKLITETNVPHLENLSYFGDDDEAQLVYQFALPPLILHSFYSGNAELLSQWAEQLPPSTPTTTFFNFTAPHDGIGVRPVTELLTAQELNVILDTVRWRGGQVSYKTNADGSTSPYELNITYFDALREPDEALSTSIDRFMTSQAIMLSLAGIPGIYFNSLIGAPNWIEGVEQTGHARTINRQKFDESQLIADIADPMSRSAQVMNRYLNLLRIRRSTTAFHPLAAQKIHHWHKGIFAVERESVDGGSRILALHNVSHETVQILRIGTQWHDLISNTTFDEIITLAPYQTLWLEPLTK